MGRISRIMLRIGMILSIVVAALLLFSSPFLITIGVSSTIRQMIIDGVANGDISTDLNPDQAALLVQTMALTAGIVLIIFGALSLADAIASSIALRKPSRSSYIACIILGFLSTEFSSAGGILGLIYEARVRRKEAREKADLE